MGFLEKIEIIADTSNGMHRRIAAETARNVIADLGWYEYIASNAREIRWTLKTCPILKLKLYFKLKKKGVKVRFNITK